MDGGIYLAQEKQRPRQVPNRLRDGWERLLQFNQQKKFCMYQEAVMIPIHPSTVGRLQRLKAADKILMPMKTGSPFTRNLSHWLNKDKVYPCNVLHLATESHNQRHCAAFPESLPTWFIQLFTQKNDMISRSVYGQRHHRRVRIILTTLREWYSAKNQVIFTYG